MPSTPPLPSDAELPSTPPTSPQRHQQAARNQERNQRNIGSPEQRRTPVVPSHPPALPPVVVEGRELTHLSLDMRMRMMDIPPHQPLRRRGHAPPQPFPLPLPHPSPLIASTVGSSSVAPALGLAFGPPLPPPPPPFPSASSSRQTLNPAQLREAYVSLPVRVQSRGRPPVSYIYIISSFTFKLTLLLIK